MFLKLAIQERIENGLRIRVLRADAPGQFSADPVNTRLELARIAHGIYQKRNCFDSNLQQELLARRKTSSGKDADAVS